MVAELQLVLAREHLYYFHNIPDAAVEMLQSPTISKAPIPLCFLLFILMCPLLSNRVGLYLYELFIMDFNYYSVFKYE